MPSKADPDLIDFAILSRAVGYAFRELDPRTSSLAIP